MTSPDALLIYKCLKDAFMSFAEAYTTAKGVDEISDVELRAAGVGFKEICDQTVEENIKRYQAGKRDGSVRPATNVERVTLTPHKPTITPTGRNVRPDNAKKR